LYIELLDSWNTRSAHAFATLFAENGNGVGFDGSTMNGRAEIEATLAGIFADHPTASYIGKVREVRFLAPDVAMLRAVAGMVPQGEDAINPAVNTIQTLVAVLQDDEQWQIALFQNTPAQFHGRPELVQQLTEELQQLL
ncbi:MAG: SgcJ/EcaC family oxidoreductase, partial [Ardenticatenales bacterium]|nr:SgcJ/EcaC family oxidoreductase [Ardenticatenales bacterium]